MLNFVLGMLLGAILGLFMFAIFSVSSDSDKKAEKMINDWVEYKCKNNVHKCGDLCCWMCIAAHNCPDVCKNTPQKCNRSVILK
ncbi:hypothetical protein [Caloramator australicus]|uniref:Uncharacterized protein n=1 Tax=Caloramator australicus RC3 TaxID=857293 RepID=I7J4Q5_9CLOT|nr:hypothetical protein [Caloramator australicus]CCJ32876.1 hypothetical protein CAAU_0792 [Caloramator australicus RC3]